MITNRKYTENITKIVHYLEDIKGFDTTLEFTNERDKLRYYMTKFFVKLPTNVSNLINETLQYEIYQNPVVEPRSMITIDIIQNDITQLNVDAIVNAANSDGVGCFNYDHKCIDNVIHNKAGPGLRLECQEILSLMNPSKIPTSGAIVTKAYNLPCKYVIHTVGPIYKEANKKLCNKQLAMCYINCMKIAHKNKWNHIAFCCISTGLYGFPAYDAADIAIKSVKKFIDVTKTNVKVIFCTFKDSDYNIYWNRGYHLLK